MRTTTMLKLALVAGAVGGALMLLRRPEAELPPDFRGEPFYPNWPEPARRFMNGGLYRGAIGFLYDMGIRGRVASSYHLIWKYKNEDAEAVRTGTVPPSISGAL